MQRLRMAGKHRVKTGSAVKIEFLIPGSPTEAFFSQVAMFRLALDALGGIYDQARVVLCLSGLRAAAIPARWRPHLRRVEIHWAPIEMYRTYGGGGAFRYELLDPSADLSCLCDADMLPMHSLDPAEVQRFVEVPAIRGVIAHYPPPLADDVGNDYSERGPEWFWQFIASQTIGTSIPLAHVYSLVPTPQPCPFYVNYGFVIGCPGMLIRLGQELQWLRPRVWKALATRFVSQISLALGCLVAKLPTEALPMRYNFPNDAVADGMYPHELARVVFMHYLRCSRFDRHRIFISAGEFRGFLELQLEGSDDVFQRRIREITGGHYPFA